jgi:hypothetical protein
MALSSILGSSSQTAQKYNPFASKSSSGSSFADALKSAGGANDSANASGKTAADSLLEVRRQADTSLAELSKSLQQVLKDSGVDTSQPIRLECDGQGGVKVAGNHPDREKIERALAENPELASKFQSLAAEYQQLHSAEKQGTSDAGAAAVFGIVLKKDEAKVEFAGPAALSAA